MDPGRVTRTDRLERILRALATSLGPLEEAPTPLAGGITNHNFRVALGGQQYVVRMHGQDTELLGIDREAERLASEAAASLGIAPAVAGALDECLVTRYVAGALAGAADLAAHAPRIARALRSFHDCGLELPSRFAVPELLERYARVVGERGGALPAAFARVRELAARVAAALAPARARPCHNDLLAGNILLDEDATGITIVDWEYAGMGDPYFDLGNLSVNNDFDERADRLLLDAYLGGGASDGALARLALMRVLSDAREGAWGVVQAHVSTLDFDFDFDGYARSHFERMLATAATDGFEEWLACASASREERRGATA
ncbi:MAG TPA: choline kinase family protein [Solirubrobacteraceae bacterium]|jgi:thiamine kinase-like enzyme|nr:choline kinase family protein [Solirubrobacteraceae bacterium]